MTVGTVRPFYLAGLRLAVFVDGVGHEVIRVTAAYASVTYVCSPRSAVLVDPMTELFPYHDTNVDCMACLSAGLAP